MEFWSGEVRRRGTPVRCECRRQGLQQLSLPQQRVYGRVHRRGVSYTHGAESLAVGYEAGSGGDEGDLQGEVPRQHGLEMRKEK